MESAPTTPLGISEASPALCEQSAMTTLQPTRRKDKNYIPRNRSDYTPYDTYENVGKAGQRLLDKGSPEAALRDASDEDFEDVDVTFASSGGLRGLVLCCLGDCCVSQDTFM